MEAPIPASALIHSATLVSAGVYLVIRFKNVILLFPFIENIIIWSSLTTLLLFTIIIPTQSDLKRLLAFSTIVNVSVLYLFAISMNYQYTCSYFIIHGLFKSCSFLILGFFIISNKHSQDFRSFNSNKYDKLPGFYMLFSIIMLSGINITYIYETKHVLLSASAFCIQNLIIFNLVFNLYAIFSVLYGIKVCYVLFFSNNSKVQGNYQLAPSVDLKFFNRINFIILIYLLLSVVVSYLIFSYMQSQSHLLSLSHDSVNTLFFTKIAFLLLFLVVAHSVSVCYNDIKYTLLQDLTIIFIFTYLNI